MSDDYVNTGVRDQVPMFGGGLMQSWKPRGATMKALRSNALPYWRKPVVTPREEALKQIKEAEKRQRDGLKRPTTDKQYKEWSKAPGPRPNYFDGSPRNDPHKATREAAENARQRAQREAEYARQRNEREAKRAVEASNPKRKKGRAA